MKIFKLTRKGRLTMAQKAGKYAAAVGCSGGELARRKIPREALTGDCRQALAEHPEGILECRWDCLGLGSDFDGIRTHAELPGADAMPVLEDALAKAGLTARQRDKVMGENVLRVYREVLG